MPSRASLGICVQLLKYTLTEAARTPPPCGPQEYVSLSFSADGKLLLAQGGGPEWNMVLWVWEKSKIAGTVKTTNQQGLPVFAVRVCVRAYVVMCVRTREPGPATGRVELSSLHAYLLVAHATVCMCNS